MSGNDTVGVTLMPLRQDTETWLMTYEHEQRDATARISIPVSLTAAALFGWFAPESVRLIGVVLFFLVSLTNFGWLFWRTHFDGRHTHSAYQFTIVADQMFLIIGSASMMLFGAKDPSISLSHQVIGWVLYFVIGFQICDAVRSSPTLATIGGMIHSTVAIMAWLIADRAEVLPAAILFLCADTYAIFHNIIRLEQLKGHARMSIDQASARETQERVRRESMEYDLKKARKIQSALNPPSVETWFADLKIDFYHRPFDILGGDWFASRTRSDGRMVIAVADVSGKGVAAAMVSQTLQSIWAQSLDSDEFSPIEWLSELNKTLIALGHGQLCTMTMGLLVVSAEDIQYYSAGHLPVFIISDECRPQDVKAIYGKGNILGAGPIDVEPVVVPLPTSGDFTLMMGTDGILDWRTRKNRRALLKIAHDLQHNGESTLDQCSTEDDKILVTLKRA